MALPFRPCDPQKPSLVLPHTAPTTTTHHASPKHTAPCPGSLQAGTTELLISGLPGFPDGISRSSDGNFWLSLVLPNVPIAHKLLPHKALRWAAAWAPQWLLPRLPQWGMVVKVRLLQACCWDVCEGGRAGLLLCWRCG